MASTTRFMIPKNRRRGKRLTNPENAEDQDEFERLFSSLWKTSKRQGVTKKDVSTQIAAYRAHA